MLILHVPTCGSGLSFLFILFHANRLDFGLFFCNGLHCMRMELRKKYKRLVDDR